ncbi:carnosine synthase 1-like [Pezoporus flaviventris]|uniref:carnosine synthase 1-like n=1 Tax=Pezoporus flaviventris TaxID=889875 RepID=UPI002AB08EED|nr:carnosine synthase 1-like [Pezoporus flaviventris]
MLSQDHTSSEPEPLPQDPAWAGPEALSPGWEDPETPGGDEPEDSGDSDGAARAYERLQSALRQEGLPPTEERPEEHGTGCGPPAMTVCILGSPSTFLPVLLEGAAAAQVGPGPTPPPHTRHPRTHSPWPRHPLHGQEGN